MIYNDAIEHIRNALNQTNRSLIFEDESNLITDNKTHIKAAILIAITAQENPHIILTQRPNWLRSHAGQVAFPGGKVDEGDSHIQHTALREAQEELSIDPKYVDVIATCDEYYSGSGYRITPIVGVITHPLDIIPNPDEVESWFMVPMSFLFDRNNIVKKSAIWNGQERSYYDMQWKDYRIWGVTAGIIANLARQIENHHAH